MRGKEKIFALVKDTLLIDSKSRLSLFTFLFMAKMKTSWAGWKIIHPSTHLRASGITFYALMPFAWNHHYCNNHWMVKKRSTTDKGKREKDGTYLLALRRNSSKSSLLPFISTGGRNHMKGIKEILLPFSRAERKKLSVGSNGHTWCKCRCDTHACCLTTGKEEEPLHHSPWVGERI